MANNNNIRASQQIRYKFDQVLVADSQLLLDEEPQQPEVLILNSKLNKCSPQQQSQNSKQQTAGSCGDSCCLRVESAEFRKRLLAADTEQQSQSDCYGK